MYLTQFQNINKVVFYHSYIGFTRHTFSWDKITFFYRLVTILEASLAFPPVSLKSSLYVSISFHFTQPPELNLSVCIWVAVILLLLPSH